MADAILSAVTQTMIENLGSQTIQEIGSLWGILDELEKMKSTVSTIQAVLLDAEEKQSHDHQVKEWLEKLNDAVFDADDLLSEFSTEAMRRRAVSGNIVTKEVRTFFSKSNQLAFRGKMSRKIKAMRQKLNAIAEDRKLFHLKESLIESASTKREETHSFVPNIDVIGREDDKESIIKLLLEADMEENVSVIAIVGLGGLGKTTLAQMVYDDEKVRKHFELKMWVCVSDVFDEKIVVQKMISRIGLKLEDHSMDQLQNQLREKIHQKKFLLVLDDVWNEDPQKWNNLKNLLMDGAKGSKVVITTRSKDITCSVVMYTLNCLSDDQSWSLFKQIAFEKGQETSNLKLEEIGREIVRICQGIPLAIKLVGGVLRFEEAERKWLNVKNNLLESVTHQHDANLPILKFSYDNLPSHLKSCFSYCSLFPKDYEIKKETLILLWIAQGFIQSSGKSQQLEDVADDYFKDLLWRSFFEEVRDEFGGLNYKVHNLIHDLALSVAGGEFQLDYFGGKNITENAHHVSYPMSIVSSFPKTLPLVKANKMRTFLLTNDKNGPGAFEESKLNTLFSSFKSLRALDLHGSKITRVPNSVGKLMHLKYLDLSFNHDIKALPPSITGLRNLQMLKLSSCNNLKELPKDMGEMISLKHLDNVACYALSHMPRGLGQMTSLQTLSLFVVSKDSRSGSKQIGGLGELNRLNNLRGTLEIRNLERLEDAYSESKSANLREKQHLERLRLSWDQEDNNNNDDEKSLEGLQPHQNLKYLEVNQYGGVRFSSWLSSLTNLIDLDLQCQECRHLPSLAGLPSLERLSLLHMVNLEYISDSDITEEVAASSSSSTTFFPSLNFIKIYKCPNLKGWWRMRDFALTTSTSRPNHQQHQHRQSLPSFPRLSSLHIQICPYLISMPLFPYLEEQLFLDNVSGKPLQQTMAAAFSHISPFSKLKSMHLMNLQDIMYLPGLNMASLKSLVIFRCPRLTSLSRAMRYLTSLEELAIRDCEEFNPSNDMEDKGLEWQHLNCLCSLTFEGLPKLESLPVGLLHVSTLQKFVISNCPNIMAFPEWIGKFASLEKLQILNCPNLKSLPDGVRDLVSLQQLIIEGMFSNSNPLRAIKSQFFFFFLSYGILENVEQNILEIKAFFRFVGLECCFLLSPLFFSLALV